LQLQNIFDKRYISAISASDDALQGNASYQVGAPFSAMLSASVDF
jgi:iron complex outermembrane receptor protein